MGLYRGHIGLYRGIKKKMEITVADLGLWPRGGHLNSK